MKRINYIVISFLLLTSFVFIGCSDFLDINKNPDKGTQGIAEYELPLVMFFASQINFDHAEYGNYLTQTYTTGGKSQSSSYAYKSGWADFLTMNRHPQWRRHYYDLGVNINEMIKDAETKKSYNFILIGRTIRLMSTLLTTDAFGDMPLSKAYTSIAPTYDTQAQVYEWLIKETDELISLYNNKDWTEAPTNIIITKKMDRIFSGDLTKWKAFTYALKARILLRKLPNWDNNPTSCQQIIDAVDNAIKTGWSEPDYRYDGGSAEKNCPWGSAQPAINGWESRKNEMDKAIPTKFLMVDMMGLYDEPNLLTIGYSEDPRLEKMMTFRAGPAIDAVSKFRYLETNIGMGVSYKETNYPDLFTSVLTKNTSYIPLMLTEELLLMKSEALYWANKKQEAFDLMKAAVDTNLVRHQASAKYVKIFKTLPKYFPTLNDFNIGHIMRHKYICMYLQPEQWTDMRRYNYSNDKNGITYQGAVIYPKLKRPFNLYEPVWMTPESVQKQEWIQRLNYDPETEEKYNKAELVRLNAYKNAEWLKKPMIWAVYNPSFK